MIVKCEKCSSEYNIDDARVPPQGLQIKCPKCLNVFLVTPSQESSTGSGAMFDLGEEGKDSSLELDLPEEAPPPAAARVGSSTLPPIGSSSLPPLGQMAPPGAPAVPPPTSGAEGQLFDFLEKDLGEEQQVQAGPVMYRIRRKSGKIFGPFDAETVKKMLRESQLMGNEEASSDGVNFKPLGSFEEFAEIIRSLLEEPAAVVSLPSTPDKKPSAQPSETVDVVASVGLDFAEPPPEEKPARSGGGAGLLIGLAAIILIAIAGVALGFTRWGFFGIKLFTGGEKIALISGGDDASLEMLRLFAEDTHAATEELIQLFQKKRAEKKVSLREKSIAVLAIASWLRNYGAHEAYLKLGRELLAELKDDEPKSPDTIKAEAAMNITTNSQRALGLLKQLLEKDANDKEALYLAGWAYAYQENWAEASRMFDSALVLDPDFSKAYHALGDIHALQKDFDSALSFYEKALERNPFHVQSAIEQARIALEIKQETGRAEELLQLVFSKYFEKLAPAEKAKAHLLRARIASRNHRHQEALENLQAVIKYQPDKLEYQAELGSFYLDMGEYAKANQYFENALQKDPKNVEALLGKGRAMWKNGDIVKAKELLENTAKLAPDDPRPLFYLGQISEDLEKPEDARGYYEKAASLSAKYLPARVALANLYTKTGQNSQALAVLSEALKANPSSALVHEGLGLVHSSQGNLQLAEKEFRTAIELDPQLASAYFNLANTLRDRGQLDEAVKFYKQTAEISPRFPGLALEYGFALYQLKQFSEALKIFEDAILHNPKDDQLYLRAGLAAVALGDEKAAIGYLQTATGINRKNTQAIYQLGLLLANKGDIEQAKELFRQVIELDAKHAEAHYQMGLCLLKQDRISDAIEEISSALTLQPKFLEAHLALGNIYLERMQYEQASGHFKEVVRQQPSNSQAQIKLADTYLKQGQAAQALKTLKSIASRKLDIPNLDYMLGRAYQELDNSTEALKYYQKAIQKNPSDPMPHFYLAYIFKARGKNRQAVAEFRAYLKLRPDAPDADEVREEIDYLLNE